MKLNIVVDLSYVFHQEYAVFSSWSKHGFNGEQDEIEFVQGLCNKFFYMLKHLPTADRVVLCMDSKSWRKGIDLPDGGYKGNRQDDTGKKKGMDEETAATFFRLQDEFAKITSRVGIITSRIGGAEGDDLVFKWTKRLYDMGESCVIISADRDLTQLVRLGDENNWVIQWNNKKNSSRITNTMYVPVGWKAEWLNAEKEVSIFDFELDTDKQDMLKLIRDQEITVEPVYPDLVVMEKILAGDDKDNVPPVWHNHTKTKAGKDTVIRMTGKKPGIVMEKLEEKFGVKPTEIMSKWEDEQFMNECAGLVLRTTKDVDGSAEREVVKDAMRRNCKLVRLTDEDLPYNLVGEIDMHIDHALATNVTQRDKWNRNGVTIGTRFDGSYVPKAYNPMLGAGPLPDVS